MRTLTCLAAAAILAAATAHADPPAAPPSNAIAPSQPPVAPKAGPLISLPHWLRVPSAQDVQDGYPAPAAKQHLLGHATIECTVTAAGKLDGCVVLRETPPGEGFGKAAVHLARQFEMSRTNAQGVSTAGAKIVVPIGFIPEID